MLWMLHEAEVRYQQGIARASQDEKDHEAT